VRNDRHWSFVIGHWPRAGNGEQGTGNGEQKTRQRRPGSWPVARRSRLVARGFLDSGDKGRGARKLPKRQTASGIRGSWLAACKIRDSGAGNPPSFRQAGTTAGRPGKGQQAAAKKAGDGELARQGQAHRPWRATAFACSRRRSTRVPQARLKVATRREPVETGATDSSSFVSPSPGGAPERPLNRP